MSNPLFTTSYNEDYQWMVVPRTPIWKPVDCIKPSLDKQQYLSPGEEHKAWAEEHERLIKKLYRSRMKSTYQRDYCKQFGRTGEAEDSEEVVDVFLQELEKYYSLATSKVLPPLATTRRVFAYGRPTFFRTGLSEYKDRICREAYNIFKRDKDAGIVRLGGTKRNPNNLVMTSNPAKSRPVDLKKTYGEGGGCSCGLDFCPCK